MRVRWWIVAALMGCAGDPNPVAADTDAPVDVPAATGPCPAHTGTLTDLALIDRLQAGAERAVAEMGVAGVAVSLSTPEGRWLGSAGAADREADRALEPNDLLRIGSVTKTFTAALVLQLQDEGLLSVDDPLDVWVPGYWDGEGITLRHLLAHTSGIVSYNYIGSFDERAQWTPTELVQWAWAHGPTPTFAPGSSWDYSNTNFVLLGLAIEAATGQGYGDALRERILIPIGLDSTFLAPDEAVPCYAARGYDGPLDVTDGVDPSVGWAAGGLLSTARDVDRFQEALHGGELLSPASLAEMTTAVKLSDGTPTGYGLGIFATVDGDYGAVYEHAGGTSGFTSNMTAMPDTGMAFAVLVNENGIDQNLAAAYIWVAYHDLPGP